MRLFCFFALLMISSNLFSQEEIIRELGDFDEIKVYDLINVNLIKADETRAIIYGPHQQDVELVNKNGVLKIKMRFGENFEGNKTNVTLYYKNIEVIDANEGSFVQSEDIIERYKIELRAQEGAVIKVNLNSSEVKIKGVTGGEIEIEGNVVKQDISLNTRGKFHGKEVTSESASVVIKAGGEAYVTATELVDIKIRAGGDVYVYGTPRQINENRVLGGRLHRVD